MVLAAITTYAPAQTAAAVAIVALAFGVVSFPSVSCWTYAGQQMARLLATPHRLRLFNWVMATLLVASLYPVVFT